MFTNKIVKLLECSDAIWRNLAQFVGKICWGEDLISLFLTTDTYSSIFYGYFTANLVGDISIRLHAGWYQWMVRKSYH